MTPPGGTLPANQRVSSEWTLEGFLGVNNKHSSRDAPPYRAHSELGSVLLARAGSVGPTASNQIARAKVPLSPKARTGPTLFRNSIFDWTRSVGFGTLGLSRSSCTGYRSLTPDRSSPSCMILLKMPDIAGGSWKIFLYTRDMVTWVS